MGRSTAWVWFPLFSGALLAQGKVAADAALPGPALPVAEFAVASLDPDLRPAEFGLGDGGVRAGRREPMRWRDDGCITPGGVRVQCQAVGVKLTFPSGRELLVAPDGHVHLRSGEVGGPFPTGLELLLADGTSVRVALAPSSAQRLRDVHVGDREQRLQIWRRGEPAAERVDGVGWAGLRMMCLGDGGDVYRVVALGPLLVLDRVLVAAERAETTPRERLVLLGTPLVQSLTVMQRQHREPKAVLRRAVAAVATIAEHGDQLFAPGRTLPRAEQRRLRWLLRAGFELELELSGPMAPRLQLWAPDALLPMVEWTLRADAAAFLTNPDDDQPGQRWHGNGTRLPRVLPELQAREDLYERGHALRVIGRLQR
jgi:hypothetical protein